MNFNFAIVRGISSSLIRDAQRIEDDHRLVVARFDHQILTDLNQIWTDIQ